MKIYFGASIRGGRSDIKIYEEIIQYLKGYGPVLTEHIANANLSSDGEKNLSDKEIHDRDIQWLKNADIMVAEVTSPSLGVGYEIRAAFEMGKPVLCLFRTGSGKNLSAMIAGNEFLSVRVYKDINTAKEFISEFFQSLEF